MGRYVVTITQKVNYGKGGSEFDETITGCFDDLEEAQDFIKAVVVHFRKTKATISYKETLESEG